MIQTYHHGRFEFFVAVIVIAIIALAASTRYALMAEDARILRLEILSHHFMTGAANARIQYLLATITDKHDQHSPLELSGQAFYFSPQGWPVSVAKAVSTQYRVTDEDCFQLWQALLQNPSPIARGDTQPSGREYRALANNNFCRYEFSDGAAYFDYYPLDGRLIFIPDRHESFNIN